MGLSAAKNTHPPLLTSPLKGEELIVGTDADV